MAKKKQSGKKSVTKATKKKASTKKTSRPARSRSDLGTIMVQGPGSLHVFGLGFISDITKAAIFRKYMLRQADIEFCKSLQTLFETNKPAESWIVDCPGQKLYRVCSPNRNPLDTSGSFGAGGRCNFGMAQRCEEFPELIASFGLYASMDEQTASIEAASGVRSSTEIIFEIAKRDGSTFKLIDYDAVVAFLDGSQAGLSRIVAEAPYNAEWSLQKNLKPSQVIGEWLREELFAKADGLFFSSTKNQAGKNVLIFSPNASGLESTYTATKI